MDLGLIHYALNVPFYRVDTKNERYLPTSTLEWEGSGRSLARRHSMSTRRKRESVCVCMQDEATQIKCVCACATAREREREGKTVIEEHSLL